MSRLRTIAAPAYPIALLGLFFAGCGGDPALPTAHLQGAVTISGAEIPADAEATLTFRPIGHNLGRSTSAAIKGGKYSAPNAPLGSVRVEFLVTRSTGKMIVPEGDTKAVAEHVSLVPSPLRDGLEIQVDGDRSDLNFDLK